MVTFKLIQNKLKLLEKVEGALLVTLSMHGDGSGKIEVVYMVTPTVKYDFGNEEELITLLNDKITKGKLRNFLGES